MKALPYIAVFLAGTIGSIVYWQLPASVATQSPATGFPTQAVSPAPKPFPEVETASPTTTETQSELPFVQRSQRLAQANSVQILRERNPILARQVAWDPQQLVLMFPSGRMQNIPWQQLQPLHLSDQPFSPSTIPILQRELQQEFGSRYRVQHSHDFLVVQPMDSRENWSARMQQFLGNVQSYFSARQFPMSAPKFPMVAVVLPNRATFEAYAESQGDTISEHYLAYYSLMSNRVVLYENSKADRQLATVYHEAFHQIAFNSAIHFRTASPPRFIAEGMATAFEAPGMHDHRRSGDRSDRMHPIYQRLSHQFLQSPTLAHDLETLLVEDRAFDVDPTKAYCLSWAVCFYLMEFHPQKFSRYLQNAHSVEPFRQYGETKRLSDFRPLAPNGFQDLARRLRQFYGS